MVALRDTHEASFDFEAWADKLNLPAEQKEKLQECHTYVVSCMHKQAEKQAAEAKKVEEGEASGRNTYIVKYADPVYGQSSGFVSGRDEYWPFPESEILSNPSLTQNPGWLK